MSETKENCPACGHPMTDHCNNTGTNIPGCLKCIRVDDYGPVRCPCTRTYESLTMNIDKTLTYGVYRLFWTDGGHSVASVGGLHDGTKWYAPSNWTSKDKTGIASTDWSKVERVELIATQRESLVGEKGAEYAKSFTPPDTVSFFHDAKPEPSLSLLIIVLAQDQCVVKEEKGQLPNLPESIGVITHGDSHTGDTFLVSADFPELRAAIDGEKPVPRIERYDLSKGDDYILICEPYIRGEGASTGRRVIAREELDALSEIAGVPLPVWSGGIWERVSSSVGIVIWRFQR